MNILEQAEKTDKVLIVRKDGNFALDVLSIKADITTKEIVNIVRNGRESQSDLLEMVGGKRMSLKIAGAGSWASEPQIKTDWADSAD